MNSNSTPNANNCVGRFDNSDIWYAITRNIHREGKWNYFTTTTGSMINAGKYTVRIIAEDAEGVAIGGVDVQ